jgi:hypothetical protein
VNIADHTKLQMTCNLSVLSHNVETEKRLLHQEDVNYVMTTLSWQMTRKIVKVQIVVIMNSSLRMESANHVRGSLLYQEIDNHASSQNVQRIENSSPEMVIANNALHT